MANGGPLNLGYGSPLTHLTQSTWGLTKPLPDESELTNG